MILSIHIHLVVLVKGDKGGDINDVLLTTISRSSQVLGGGKG